VARWASGQRRNPPLLVCVLVHGGALLGARGEILQHHGVAVAADPDLVLEPGTWHEGGPRLVLLPNVVVPVQVSDEIAGGDLVDGARAVLPQPVRFRTAPVEVLAHVAPGSVVDLNLEARVDRGPRRVFVDRSTIGERTSAKCGRDRLLWVPDAEEDAAIVSQAVEDPELQ